MIFITANLANAILTDHYGVASHVHHVTQWLALAGMAAYLFALWHGHRSRRRAEQNTL